MEQGYVFLIGMLVAIGVMIVALISAIKDSDNPTLLEKALVNLVEKPQENDESNINITVDNAKLHEIVYDLGYSLTELKGAEQFNSIKNDIHPKAIEYYEQVNMQPIEIKKKTPPKLALVE
jgi:hypothetical protein